MVSDVEQVDCSPQSLNLNFVIFGMNWEQTSSPTSGLDPAGSTSGPKTGTRRVEAAEQQIDEHRVTIIYWPVGKIQTPTVKYKHQFSFAQFFRLVVLASFSSSVDWDQDHQLQDSWFVLSQIVLHDSGLMFGPVVVL